MSCMILKIDSNSWRSFFSDRKSDLCLLSIQSSAFNLFDFFKALLYRLLWLSMYNNPVLYMNVVHYMYTSLEVAFCIQSISFMLQGGSMSSLMSQKDIFIHDMFALRYAHGNHVFLSYRAIFRSSKHLSTYMQVNIAKQIAIMRGTYFRGATVNYKPFN